MDIAGYSGLELLGRGGFSSVYRAHQAAQSRDVAIKVLTVDVSDDTAKARFERECAANGRLGSHPNVMTVFESGYTTDGKPYISMELCPGGSLADQLSSSVFSVEDVLRIGVKIAGAIETAHRNGITHRDIKPENILTTSFGEVVLADFGISALDSVRSGTATAGSFTLSHVPPEVLQGEVSGVPGDIYSLGSTLYRLLTGKPPFADETTPLAVAITRTLNDPLPDPGSHVPASLTRALEASMAKEPSRRPSTALVFAEMLQQVQKEIGRPQTEPVVASIPPASAAPASPPPSVPGGTTNEPVSEKIIETVRPAPVNDTVRPAPHVGTLRPETESETPAPEPDMPVVAATNENSAGRSRTGTPSSPAVKKESSGGERGKSKMLVVVGAVVVALAVGGIAVLGGGGDKSGGSAGIADTTQPAVAPPVDSSPDTSTSIATSATDKPVATTVAPGKATGSGSKTTVVPTTVAKKQATATTAAPAATSAPAVTSAPVTTVAASASAATTTTVKVSVAITTPKIIILGCITRATCAQALVDAWVKNDLTAARNAATSSNNYAAVTTMFAYPYKTYGAGFASTVVKVSETVYTLSSTRTATPTKFSIVFDGSDLTSVKVLAVLVQSK